MLLWDENEEEYIDFYDWSNDPRSQPIDEEAEDGDDAAPYPFPSFFAFSSSLSRTPLSSSLSFP